MRAVAAEDRAVSQGLDEALRNRDLPGAFQQMLSLAEVNELEAQHNLSLFYWHGVGATQNFDEAIRWSTMAAVRGYKKAVAARRVMVESIDPQVVKKAMDWVRARLTKDAEAGDDTALMPLSTSYLPAFGAPNPAEAYFWAALSVSTGKAEAKRQRDSIVSTMNQSDVMKAQQRANDWVKRWRKKLTEDRT
jgi:TPR repeat protein